MSEVVSQWLPIAVAVFVTAVATALMVLHADVRHLRGLLQAHIDLHERDERLFLSEMAANAKKDQGQ